MRIKGIEIDRLPGINTPFVVDEMAPGLNVIMGPNGIGKSQLCRAVESLWLGEADLRDGYRKAALLVEEKGVLWRVERDGSRYLWTKNGSEERPLVVMSPSHVSHFFLRLRDLLGPAREASGSLAEEIQRQMSGGFNLRSAIEEFSKPMGRSFGNRERRSFDEATKAVRRAVEEQSKLSSEAARLGKLEKERDDALREPRRINSFKHAIDLRRALDRLADEERKFRDLPPALANLSGGEAKQMGDLEQDLAQAKVKLRRSETKKLEAQEKAQKTNLEMPLKDSLLQAWVGQADRICQVEDRLSRAMSECNDAQGRLDQAMSNGGFSALDGELPSLDMDASAPVFQYLGDCQKKRERRARIREEVKIFESPSADPPKDRTITQAQTAIRALEAWLRVPDFSEGSEELETVPTKKQLLGSGLLFLLLGTYLGLQVHPSLWAFGGMGLAWVAVGFVVRARGNEGKIRSFHREIQGRFPEAVESPKSWDVVEVESQLMALRSQLAELQVLRDNFLLRRERRREAKNRLHVLDAEIEELEEEGAAMAADLGYENVLNDTDLVNRIRALDHLRSAAEVESGKRLKLSELRKTLVDSLDGLAREITPFGEVEPQNGSQAKAFVRSLESRTRALETAQKDEQNANQEIRETQLQIGKIEEKIQRLYQLANLNVGDKEDLRRLSDMVKSRGYLVQKIKDLKGEIASDRRRLKEAKEEPLAQRSEDDLNCEMSRLEELQTRAGNLQEEISDIKSQVDRQRKGSAIEKSLAQQESRLMELAERKQESLQAHAACFLLERVREKHEKDQMPQVFAGAKKYFQEFTNFAYDLEMSFADVPRFIALETSTRKPLELEELSDGTRVQLILAAKFSFAASVEKGITMPLFLDEAMDHSDPVRFSAIAKSLARMTQDGRQVFYLTSDDGDIERLNRAFSQAGAEAARVHDLGQIRRQQESRRAKEAISLKPLPQVTEPGDMKFEDYVFALKAPQFLPSTGYKNQHLAYLLWDDLTLSHKILSLGIETVGQWQSGLKSEGIVFENLASEGVVGPQLSHRADLLETFCQAWSVGRGRSIDRFTIETCGVVSATYMERIVALVEKENGSAAGLMEVLQGRRPGRPNRFQTEAVDKLLEYFLQEGFIDDRPKRTQADITTEVLMTPAANLLPESIPRESVHLWWQLSPGGPTQVGRS